MIVKNYIMNYYIDDYLITINFSFRKSNDFKSYLVNQK